MNMKLDTFYNGKKILVTGGCGFIGSSIVEQLVAHGAAVTILDNLSTGFISNIAAVRDRVTLIEGDITDPATCKLAVHDNEIIFHLAAFISVPESIANPIACYKTNIDGTMNVLEAARTCGARRIILSSSAAVYGLHEGVCSENTPCAPTSPYGYAKLIDELLLEQYSKNYGLETVMLRYFNVYGPRQNPNGSYAAAVAKFNHQMINNKPITLFGDGMQTRDFVPVERVANANLIMGMLDKEKVNTQRFNVGTGNSVTLLELVEMLKKDHPAYREAIIFAPARAGDVKVSAADCSKFNNLN
jgi:UDP-glucose 4-epimerase